jgi:Uma2 family endonuclease
VLPFATMSLAWKIPPPQATYADLEAVPSHKVAELIGGVLHVMPRPAFRHANAESGLVGELRGPFQRGRGGPGGWWIVAEPELHFPDPTGKNPFDALVPDVAGWRLERMPVLPDTAAITLAPDWVCEVLSPTSTEQRDREEKMPLYALAGVGWAWLVDPVARVLEVYQREGGAWAEAGTHRGSARVRVPPFEAIELELEAIWGEV